MMAVGNRALFKRGWSSVLNKHGFAILLLSAVAFEYSK